MKRIVSSVLAALALSACTNLKPPSTPQPDPTNPPAAQAYSERSDVLHVQPDDKPVAGCSVTYKLALSDELTGTTDAGGAVGWLVRIPSPDPGGGLNAHVHIECPDFDPYDDSFVIAPTGNQDIWFGGSYQGGNQPILRAGPKPVARPKPWETVTVDQLRAWRGSISTTLAPMPCGPRPDQPNNVMFTAEFGTSCWPADAKSRAIAAYVSNGWVHWAIGPVESMGYHNRYPDQNWIDDPNGFADLLEQLWNAGRIPVLFLLPDTGFCADGQTIDHACVESRLTAFYSHPRIQALAKIVVLAWEPEYLHDDFLWGAQWMARTFPNARRGIHNPSGHAATCRGSELVEAGGNIPNEGACWADIASLIHFYLLQDTWVFGGEGAPERTPLQQFLYNLWDIGRRFTDCYAGWPCAGADGKSVDVVAYEYSSYYVTNDPSRATEANQWGDASISSTPFTDPLSGQTIDAAKYVVGYGDGGTLDPLPRLPRRTFSFTPSTTAPHFTFSFTHSQR